MVLFTGVLLLDILGIITSLTAIGILYFKWAFQYWKKRNVPYSEPSIPFGNFLSPFKSSITLGTELPSLYEEAKSKGWKYVGIYFMMRPLLMIVDLDVLKHILVKDFNNFVDRGFYSNEKDDPISAHLFALGGQKWKNLRAKMSPAFTSGKLKAMFPTVMDAGVILEKYIEEHARIKQAIDIKEVLVCFTIDTIGSCAFGLDINSFENPESQLRQYSREFCSPNSITSLVNMFAQSFPNIAQSLRVPAVRPYISKFFTEVVENTVAYREKNKYSRKDFLQLLIDIKNNKELQENGNKGDGSYITMNEIVAQSFVFFIAGFETSSSTTAFALFELATNPKTQEKLRNEINTVLAKHDHQVTYDSLSEMKYMDQVIYETLRMHPAVPYITRVAGSDYKLPGGNNIIEKGTQVLIPIESIHDDEEYFPNPDVFDPERFNDENKNSIPPYAHMPFGGGPRLCIGERFGTMQTKVGLTSILRSHKVTLNKKTPVPLKMATNVIVPMVEGGIWIDLERT